MEKKNNFSGFFLANVTKLPNKTAIIGDGYTLTYKQFNTRINQAAHLFASLNIKKGDRIALLFSNSPKFLEVMYAAMRVGAIPVPINIKLPPASIEYIIGNCQPKLILYYEKVKDKFKQLKLPKFVENAFQVSTNQKSVIKNNHSYDYLLEKSSGKPFIEKVSLDDICFLPYTSGSTGFPKGCKLTNRGQFWNSQALKHSRQLTAKARLLVSAPIYHANALVSIQSTLLAGGSLVVLPDVDYKAILQAIEKYKITFLTAVPTIYQRLLNYYHTHPDYNLSSVNLITNGSSNVTEQLSKNLKRTFNANLIEGYGLTEGGPEALNEKIVNGKVIPGMTPLPKEKIKIVKNNNHPAQDNEVGELWLKNPGVAKGYWKMPQKTKESFENGWLKTGDLVKRNKNNAGISIVGRKDDMINIAGENTYPKEVENILLKDPEIVDTSVSAIANKDKGQVPVALVVLKKNTAQSQKNIQDFFFKNGPAYAYPRHIFFVDHIPLKETGKIDSQKIKTIIQSNLKQDPKVRLQKLSSQSEAGKRLNLKVQTVKPDYVVLKVPFDKSFLRGNDKKTSPIHGGIIASLVDIAGAYAFFYHRGSQNYTINLNTDFLLPALPKDLYAKGQIIRAGRRILVSRIDVYQKDPYKRVAIGRGIYNASQLKK